MDIPQEAQQKIDDFRSSMEEVFDNLKATRGEVFADAVAVFFDATQLAGTISITVSAARAGELDAVKQGLDISSRLVAGIMSAAITRMNLTADEIEEARKHAEQMNKNRLIAMQAANAIIGDKSEG